jgi:hypothetical protein
MFAGSSPDEVDSLKLPYSLTRTMTLGSTHFLAEMITNNLPGSKGRPAHMTDLTAICEQTVKIKYGNLDVSQPYWPSWPITGIAFFAI